VIPAYNEAENLEPLLTELAPPLESLARPFEVLLFEQGRGARHRQQAGQAHRHRDQGRRAAAREQHDQPALKRRLVEVGFPSVPEPPVASARRERCSRTSDGALEPFGSRVER
jgi:hypothetical protein